LLLIFHVEDKVLLSFNAVRVAMKNIKVNYRAVHTKNLWRRVHNHHSLSNALYSDSDGAVGLFSKKARIDYAAHGDPLFVCVWQDGAMSGFIVKSDPLTTGIVKKSISVSQLCLYDRNGGASVVELESYFLSDDVDVIERNERVLGGSQIGISDFLVAAEEGNLIRAEHLKRERNISLANAKKEQVLKEKGRLQCEACDFDFVQKYGELGNGFCEVHHLHALSARESNQTTCIEDLAVLCSNCHSIIHRFVPLISPSELRNYINEVSISHNLLTTENR